MTHVKICGITNLDDARAAVDAGADAIGFVFAPSPRRISPELARAIAAELAPRVVIVGVFADTHHRKIRDCMSWVGLDCVQLHGDETPENVAALCRCTIKRFCVHDNETAAHLDARLNDYRVFASLLDPGSGSGRSFRWEQARGIRRRLIIAGGLTPENVAEPIRLLRPFGVDVASGVESAPGQKDHAKLRAFIQAVRAADADRTA